MVREAELHVGGRHLFGSFTEPAPLIPPLALVFGIDCRTPMWREGNALVYQCDGHQGQKYRYILDLCRTPLMCELAFTPVI